MCLSYTILIQAIIKENVVLQDWKTGDIINSSKGKTSVIVKDNYQRTGTDFSDVVSVKVQVIMLEALTSETSNSPPSELLHADNFSNAAEDLENGLVRISYLKMKSGHMLIW